MIHHVGHGPHGRLYVDMKLDRTSQIQASTSHDPVPAGSPTLSIVGLLVESGRRSVTTSGGGLVDELRHIHTPAAGWTPSDLGTLLRIWRNFHLNYLQAGCVHMRPRRARLDEQQVCNKTGYRYGAAWLYEPIPADALKDVKRVQSLPVGKIPAYVR